MATRQEKIMEYVHILSEQLIASNQLNDNNGADALNTSLDLQLDRANVSKDLNALWKAGKLIKMHGKPVFYLDYHSLTKHYPNSFFPSLINNGDKISNYLHEASENTVTKENTLSNEKGPLDSIIGANGSLSDVIFTAKSAISYPPYGIPSIIYGNSGVGKTLLANQMVEYLCKIKHKEKVPVMTLYAQNYQNDANLFVQALTGVDKGKGKVGVLEQCEDGVLIIEQVENLSYTSQTLLSMILQKKKYTTTHTSNPMPLKTMIILTTSLKEDNRLIETLSSATPIHLKLSDIDQRGIYEKLELIMALLSQEAKNTGISIRIHKDIIAMFALQKYPNNISDLRNEIQLACSRAFLNTPNIKNKSIYLTYDCLSLNMLSQSQDSTISNARIISLLSCIPNNYLQFESDGSSSAQQIFTNAPDAFKDHRINQFIGEFNKDIEELDNIDNYVRENINVLKDCPDAQLQSLRVAINPYVMQVTLSKLQERPEYKLLQSNTQLLYGILLHITNYLKRIQYTDQSNIEDTPSLTEPIYTQEYQLAKDIYESFGQTYSFTPSSREIDFLASYIAIANQWANHTTVAILVICHGNSIASQMVEFVKENIHGKYTLDAIDYSSSMQINDCLELACIKANQINNGVGVLVVCDMEPLTSIGDYVYRETGIPARTVSNINLSGLIGIVQQSMSAINDLDALASGINKEAPTIQQMPQNTFIEQIRNRIISNTVSFIDTHKAVDVLLTCLNNTLKELAIPYSDALAVKYICHCTNMLERVIKNEPWEYKKVNQFYKDHSYLIHVIQQNLEYAGNSFGISIPATELAYISEIFLPEFKGE